MIVLGADTHKRSHTIAAVASATGELLGQQTVQVGAKGFAALVVWARELGSERVWALEDCRHVSGSFERFLIARGERVLRVTTTLMADSRRRARGRGKSDSIDALAVARAALREGLDALPAAQLQGPELDLRLLVDHRERLVRQRVALNNTLQWHLHDLWPELRLPGSSLFYGTWGPRVARRLARTDQTMRVRIARDELRRIRELSQTIKALEAEIAGLVAEIAPQLLSEPGLGPLTAAKLVGEIAGAERFASDAKLARAAGVAPIPVSSGNTNRHRLDRGGNRQINAGISAFILSLTSCLGTAGPYIEHTSSSFSASGAQSECHRRAPAPRRLCRDSTNSLIAASRLGTRRHRFRARKRWLVDPTFRASRIGLEEERDELLSVLAGDNPVSRSHEGGGTSGSAASSMRSTHCDRHSGASNGWG